MISERPVGRSMRGGRARRLNGTGFRITVPWFCEAAVAQQQVHEQLLPIRAEVRNTAVNLMTGEIWFATTGRVTFLRLPFFVKRTRGL